MIKKPTFLTCKEYFHLSSIPVVVNTISIGVIYGFLPSIDSLLEAM